MHAAEGPSTDEAPTTGERPRGRRRLGVLLALAAVVWGIDQVAKLVAVAQLSGVAPIELAGGLLTLRLVRNPGAAFGLAQGMTLLFSVVAVIVIVVVLRTARRLASLPWALALGLLLGGALGNLTDRAFRAPGFLRGHVVDMFELPNWPVFNVADMSIVGASALMVLLSLTGRQLDGTRERGAGTRG